MKTIVLSAVALCAVGLFGAEPPEVSALRELFERKKDPIWREAEARLRPLREEHAAELEKCAKRLKLEGRDEDAAVARAERDKVLEELGVKPGVAAASAVRKPVARLAKPAPVVKEKIRTRKELLAEAKQRLNEHQYAVAERLEFKEFTCEAAKGDVFCLVKCSGVEQDGVFQHSDLTAELRYLMEAGPKPLIFDSATVEMRPVPAGSGWSAMVGGTCYEMDRRENLGIPLAARLRVYYFGVLVYEGEYANWRPSWSVPGAR